MMTLWSRDYFFRPLAIVAASLFLVCALSAQSSSSGYIKARGKPGRAAVFINGTYAGPAVRFTVPEKYQAPAGEVEVSIRDPRYEEYTTKVTVKPDKTTKLHYSLKKLPVPEPPFGRFRLVGGEPESFLSVSSGDTGAVYLNGRFYGYVDELNNAGSGLLLKPGTYDLRVSSQRFGEIQKKITIEANKVTTVSLGTKE